MTASPETPRAMVTVSIDGREFRVEAGRNMLDVALSLGFDVPFFCWHPVMGSIGACRQCAVRLIWTDRDGKERSEIAMACMTEAQEGTRIVVDDDEAVRFRAEMIELMMASHPHDCPVCDEGGECHLQDMTVMTGHSYRRNRRAKRTFRNQDLGPFVAHEMNRCITCYRCARFYNDYAGGRDFGVFGLRDHVYFGRVAEGALESEFSGNLVEVCPTGVFTDKTLGRHYSRKWDLQTAPSVCPHCGLGCTTTPGARYGEVRRVLSRFNPDVNKMFLCDRGRFGYEFVNAPERERSARIAGRPAPVDAQGGRALDAAAALLCDRRVIGIGSPRASLEDNFALRTLVGADRFYLGMSATDRDLVGEVLDIARGGLHLSSLRDVHDAGAVVVLGEDLTDTAPMLDLTLRTWLRLRPTAEEERVHIRRWNDAAVGRAKRREPSVLWVATTHATKLDEVAAESWHAAPDDIARHALALAHELDGGPPDVPGLDADEGERVARWAAALRGHPAPLVVSGTSSGSPAVLGAAARLARALATAGAEDPVAALSPRVLLTVPEANSLGLAMMGGGGLPEAVAAAARGEADTVVVLGDDLYRRAAPLLVDDLLRPGRGVVVLASLFDKVTARADVALPTTTVAESSGTFVNNEGRAQRFFAVLPPGDGMRDGWRWTRDLARLSGRSDQADWETLDDVIAALERDLPQFRGLSAAAPGAGWRLRDRVVARQPLRWSGRTAADADLTLREPAPAADPDSALAFSLEGLAPSEAPAALLPRVWSPGWNSWNGLHKLQEEVNGPLRDGPTGVRLLDGPVETRPASTRARLPSGADGPRRFVARLDEFLLVPAHHIFGSDDLSMRSPGIAARAPQPYIGVNDADAARLGLVPGDHLALWLPWLDLRAAYRPMPSLPDGVAALPVGLPGRPYVSLPARGRLTRIAGPKATS